MAKTKMQKLQRFSKRILNPKPHMKYWFGSFYEYAPIRKGTILLESFHGKTINDSPLVCAQEIERLYPGKYRMYYATDNIEEHKAIVEELGLNVELVSISSMKYMYVLATAEYIISNASLPIYYIRKDGQKYLQTWHGTPLKTLGKKMREGIESMYNVQHNFLQATHLLFPNEFTRKAIMEDYNLEDLYTGQVVMCGYPRNQVFFDSHKAAEIRTKYDLEDKTVYAYMPTWRGTSNRNISNLDYFIEVRKIFMKLDKRMRDDQVMYVNFHPIIKGSFSFEGYKHIKPFPSEVSNYEFLNACDALITDYSSVFFDFSLTGKPIIMFMYDYDKYLADRGLYMDLSTLPFRQIYKISDFIKCITEDACLEDSYSGSEYAKQFLGYDSPDCTEKLLRMFLEDDDSLHKDDYASNKDRTVKVYKPRRVIARADLKTLSKVANDRDSVVLMYRDWFRNGIGQMLYDDYNDDFTYVITTNAPPRTYLSQFLKKLGSQRAAAHIAENDRKRCFGDLNTAPEYITEFGLIEEGCNVDRSAIVRTNAELMPANDGTIQIRPDQVTGLTFKKAILLDQTYALVESRDLTEEEASGGFIKYDFRNVIENYLVYNKEYCVPGILAEDAEGKECIVCYTDTALEAELSSARRNIRKKRAYVPSTGTYQLPVDYDRADFKAILGSPDKYTRDTYNSYNTSPAETKLAFVPSLFDDNIFNIIKIRVCLSERAIDQLSEPADIRRYRFDNDGFTVHAYLPSWKKENITGLNLILDSAVEDKTIPVSADVRETKKGSYVTARLNFDPSIEFQPLRWHCRIAVHVGDEDYSLRLRCVDPILAFMMKIRNVQSEVSDGWILYPYIGKGKMFKLCYREKTKYDTSQIRRKEFLALIVSFFANPILKRREYYLVYEKFSSTAQDNAYFFFKYCMEQLPEEEKNKFMYVIDKQSVDYQYVKKYEPKIIDFMSIKHMVLAMSAKLVISTDSIQHFYAWRSKPSLVLKRIQKKDVLFLQHGVTAMKRVDRIFGRKGSSPMKYFVTTSAVEQEIVVNNFGYTAENAPMVGFTRWDALEDKTDPDDRFILVMPTWRAWLEDVSEENFKESDYYRNYSEFMKSEALEKLLEENNLRVIMYLHPKFASYVNNFKAIVSDRIELIPFGQHPLNELMMRCSLLITDYSSVCWDVLYMDKPVIYYHFDLDKYLAAHGSYIDLTRDLPSPRVTNQEDLLKEIGSSIADDFVIRDEYRSQLGRFFAHRDKYNCERTYQFLKGRDIG